MEEPHPELHPWYWVEMGGQFPSSVDLCPQKCQWHLLNTTLDGPQTRSESLEKK